MVDIRSQGPPRPRSQRLEQLHLPQHKETCKMIGGSHILGHLSIKWRGVWLKMTNSSVWYAGYCKSSIILVNDIWYAIFLQQIEIWRELIIQFQSDIVTIVSLLSKKVVVTIGLSMFNQPKSHNIRCPQYAISTVSAKSDALFHCYGCLQCISQPSNVWKIIVSNQMNHIEAKYTENVAPRTDVWCQHFRGWDVGRYEYCLEHGVIILEWNCMMTTFAFVASWKI